MDYEEWMHPTICIECGEEPINPDYDPFCTECGIFLSGHYNDDPVEIEPPDSESW